MVDIIKNIPASLGLSDTVAPADTLSPASTGRRAAKELRAAHSARSIEHNAAKEASPTHIVDEAIAAKPAGESPRKGGLGSYIPGVGTLLGITGALGLIELPFVGLGKALNFVGTKTKLPSLRKTGERIEGAIDATNKPTLRSSFGVSDRGIIKDVADKTSKVVEHTGVDRLQQKLLNPHRHHRRAEVRLNNARTSAKGIVATGHAGLDRELQGIGEVAVRIASPEKAESSLETIGKASERIENLVKKDKTAKKAYKAVRKNVDITISELERTVVHHGKATGSGSISKGIKNLSKTIPEIKTKDAIMHLSWIGMTGIEFKGHWDEFVQTIKSSKQIYADRENRDVKDISDREFLFAKLPTPLARDRAHAFKILGVNALSSVASAGIMLWQLVRSGGRVQRGGSMAGSLATDMLAFQGPQWGADAITTYLGQSMAPTYVALREIQKNGKDIPLEGYTALLVAGCPELKKKSNAFSRAVAKQYLEAKASPKQVLDEIIDGTVVNKRIPDVIAANKAAKAAKAEYEAQHPEQHSHVAALNGDKKHRTVEHEAHAKHSHVSSLTEKKHRHVSGEHAKRVTKDSDLPVERGV